MSWILLLIVAALSPATQPSSQPTKLPFINLDLPHHQIHVQCESIDCKAPLEFFCCRSGSNEHESVLRSKVKPSDLHLALLMVGAEPGQGVHWDEKQQKWIAPTGSKLTISCQWDFGGKHFDVPAEQLMRDLKTHKTMPEMRWVFAGSRVIPQGYAADMTGYLVSIVNFELTVVDVPMLASSDNTTLMWEENPELVPPKGTKMLMTIEAVK